MLRFLRQPDEERSIVIRDVSLETGLPEAIVEKDLWVCYTLDFLFHRSLFKDSIVFKGGTSLSKAFGLIERFSEDIDLILDWRLLGYGFSEPWAERSNSGQERFKEQTIERMGSFLTEAFVPAMKETVSEELGIGADIRVGAEEETVLFAYPHKFSSKATLDAIKLEIGPLAAWSPSAPASITSYISERHSELFKAPSTVVRTAIPERTFWEKATILHQEANRPTGKVMPRRYARHYYDMFKLGHSEVAERALARPDLLTDVVAFKEKFYRTPWAKLVEAKPGSLRLVPNAERIEELQSDYDAMRPMIFGKIPSLEEIVAYLSDLERSING